MTQSPFFGLCHLKCFQLNHPPHVKKRIYAEPTAIMPRATSLQT